ncbi:MAG: hypothetical protein ACRC46_06920 [Thermoguttaceae bacterium]
MFTDCVHLLTLHEPGNELRLLSEVTVPGGSVDYFLLSVRNNRVVDFVGIELQTLDTTGSLWYERAMFVKRHGVSVKKSDLVEKSYGMNWKMSAKTILVQMHHKIQTFEHLNKHLVLVIQDCFHDYMTREFNFSHIVNSRLGDPLHIHTYQFDTNNAIPLRLHKRFSTDASGLAVCLGLNAEANVALDEIVKYLETRISDSSLLQLV